MEISFVIYGLYMGFIYDVYLTLKINYFIRLLMPPHSR